MPSHRDSWSYHVVSSSTRPPLVIIDAVPRQISQRRLPESAFRSRTFVLPPAPCPPYLSLPCSPRSSIDPFMLQLSQSSIDSLFPINLLPPSPFLLSSYQHQLLTDVIPAHTTVNVDNCSSSLFEVMLGSSALTTAEFATFLNFLARSKISRESYAGGAAYLGFCPPTGTGATDLLLGNTVLWTLHPNPRDVWTATVDTPLPTASHLGQQ
ncbi:hypothetical protein MIND_01280600 [Mycena indigotica]|uniref:Uncharacterized protein n=1 Tax=Mycena indigotica TaxID=2126181 RepID=A0A8H6VTH0_9AGAR|nr:uncharacterized protein MIND_01280600 [Mycena indigotica]KAF7291361.1 hypothetical protein MIND_01280600 [Mycena indigotica]